MRTVILFAAVCTLLFCVADAQPSAPGSFIGLFLSASDKSLCGSRYYHSQSAYPAPYNQTGTSADVLQCEHTTVVFQPKDLADYALDYGTVVKLTTLLYGYDLHAAALMVRMTSANGVDDSVIVNAFPHITISNSKNAPYQAVYSNWLWTRLNATNYFRATDDIRGKPYSVELYNENGEGVLAVDGTLPAYTGPDGTSYDQTPFHAQIIAPFTYKATFCYSVWWKNDECNVPSDFNGGAVMKSA